MTNEEIKKSYSMKILFGPMFGCELHLPADDYFLIINPGLALLDKNTELDSVHEHAAYYATSTLYIPCDIASPNISLRLSEPCLDNDCTYFNIEVHDKDGNNYKSSLKENDIFTHKHIKIAVKGSDDVWSDNIENYHGELALSEFNSSSKKNKNRKKYLLMTLIGLFILTVVISLSFFAYQNAYTNQQVTTLSESLSGAPDTLEIVKGRDNKNIYVLAKKNRELEWVKEAIYKLNDQSNLVPVLLSKSKKDIISELSNVGYPVLQLDYSSSKYPVLAIYRTLTTSEEASLKKLVLQKIPYALDVRITIKTKEQLIKDARQGLDRLNIPYRQITTTTGYSLVVRDALSDNSLNALRDFINKYSYQWGNTVITFSINLDENWLQNKSYVSSSKGYLFLNPRHWYFPLNNKGF